MRDCTICIVKTKALISFAVTAKLVCAFDFSYENCWFSDAVALLIVALSAYPHKWHSFVKVYLYRLAKRNLHLK